MGAAWVPYYKKLKSDICACGHFKTPLTSFCKVCYRSLPDSNQSALYRKLGAGYELAYDHAVEILTKNGRIKKGGGP